MTSVWVTVGKRVTNPRQGDHPKNWPATDPRTGGHQPKDWTGSRYFFNLSLDGGGCVVAVSLGADLTYFVLEVVVRSAHCGAPRVVGGTWYWIP